MVMTRSDSNDASRLAVLHRTGVTWRCLVADLRGRRPEVVATRDFDLDAVNHALDGWLDEHDVEAARVVLPGGGVICRTCSLPDVDEEQLEQALHLQAEAHLLGIAPAHRLAMAVIDEAPGETTRTGLILAWPETVAVSAPTTTRPVTFVPVVAALAGLIDGQRPAEPLLWVDRADGSLALALSHAGGVSFRATREATDDRATWSQQVTRALAETGFNANHTEPFIESLVEATNARLGAVGPDDATLFLPADLMESIRRRLDRTTADDAWWSRYGVTAGAVLAAAGPLQPLTVLLDDEPAEHPSRIRHLVEALNRPRTAMTAVAVCLLALLIGPIIIKWAHLKVLDARHGDLETRLASIEQTRHQLAMYRALDTKSWSMTKLLGDIAVATPPGVELNYIRINQNESFSISGVAQRRSQEGLSATEVIEQMIQSLGETGIFSNMNVSWGEPSRYGSYEFDITAAVIKPHFRPAYPAERDWAVRDMQALVDGKPIEDYTDRPTTVDDDPADAASTSTAATPTPDPPARTPDGDDDDTTIAAATDGEPDRPVRPGARPGARPEGMASVADAGSEGQALGDPSKDIPEPLTDAQINAMTVEEARAALSRVSQARKYNKENQELQDRLASEFRKLIARLREAA